MTPRTPVYLDHHATTPIDPRVLTVLQDCQREHFGNPASAGHALGWAAAAVAERARAQVAALIGAEPAEIVFTSGATESDNLALLGVAEAPGRRPGHLVTTALEHPAVAGPAARLQELGWRVTTLGVGRSGVLDVADLAAALAPDTVLVSVIAAQHEIGTLQPLAAIGRLCRERGVLLHSDAAQAAGKVPLDVTALGVDLLSLSGHKLYGPKGVGALYVRRRTPRVRLLPRAFGGGQEGGLRPGTLNVPGIAAFGEACRLAGLELAAEAARLTDLRGRLLGTLTAALPGVHLNGAPAPRLPGNLNLGFAGVPPGSLPGRLTLLAVSTGAACASADGRPSPTLTAIGVSAELAAASLRLGLGRFTTTEEVDFAAAVIIRAVRELREGGPGGGA